jgi:hypothetical protein
MAPNESSDPAADPGVADLKDAVAALQRQLVSLMLAVIVVSGTVSLYLYRQASLTRKDLAQAEKMVAAFQHDRPEMLAFLGKLNDYGKTHPDVYQILVHNGFAAPTAPAAAPPAAAPKK